MGARNLIVRDARLQLLLRTVRDSQCSFMLFTRLKDIAIKQIDYGITDIVADIILLLRYIKPVFVNVAGYTKIVVFLCICTSVRKRWE